MKKLLWLLVAVSFSASAGLEDLTGPSKFLDDLVVSNPDGATDPKSEGDDHVRGIKNVLKNTFPNINAAVTATATELNILDGVTASLTELNYLDITTLGTSQSSKAVTADSSGNVTFVGSANKVSATSADWFWNETDAASDAKLWNIRANGSFSIRACDDAVSSCESAITISRSTNTIGTILFDNGAVDIDETLNVDGAATFAGNITQSKACESGYSRAAPGFCRRTSQSATNLTETCAAITVPAGTPIILVELEARALSANGVGQRATTTALSTASDCSTTAASAAAISYEFSAITANLGLDAASSVFVMSTASTLYGRYSDDTGDNGTGSYRIVGYWDN